MIEELAEYLEQMAERNRAATNGLINAYAEELPRHDEEVRCEMLNEMDTAREAAADQIREKYSREHPASWNKSETQKAFEAFAKEV